jgi:hypothetical protein
MNPPVPSRLSLAIRYALGVVLVVALSLALFAWMMSRRWANSA